MTLDSRLKAAVEQGIVDADTAERLATFLADSSVDPAPDDETQLLSAKDVIADAENVRFARGFHDVFLTLGIVILLLGIGFLFGRVLGPIIGIATVWVLAEFYTHRRRLVLPGIALAIGFVVSGSMLTDLAFAMVDHYYRSQPLNIEIGLFSLASGAGGLIAGLLFYRRFELPFTVSLIAISAVIFLANLLGLMTDAFFSPSSRAWFFVFGLTIFSLAMKLDVSDRNRETLAADKAFWLHLTSAPLIMHSVFGATVFGAAIQKNLGLAPFSIIALIAILAVVAVAIDRRALLIAGFAYFGWALHVIIDSVGYNDSPVLPLTLLLLGGIVVVLGTKWTEVRNFVVIRIVPAALATYLPPPTKRTP